MSDQPICQFGPGGEFVRPWPPSASPLRPAQPAQADGKQLQQQAAQDGLEAPVVSLGPDGIQWQAKDVDVTAKIEHPVASAARYLVRLLEGSAEAHGSTPLTPERRDRAIRRLAEDIAAADAPTTEVVRERTMSAKDVAVTTPAGGRIDSDTGFMLAVEGKETHYARQIERAEPHAQADGDLEADSELPTTSWLFPDHAGDWGSARADKGHRVRARRRPRRKRAAEQGSQAQGSLFTGV